MRYKSIFAAALCLLIFSVAHIAFAQDANVAGTWELSAPGRNGNTMTQTLTLQQDGAKLTGSMAGRRGSSPVTGTVSGNNISFSVTRNTRRGQFQIDYTGIVNGDSMKGTFTMRGNTVNWEAKRSGGQSGNLLGSDSPPPELALNVASRRTIPDCRTCSA